MRVSFSIFLLSLICITGLLKWNEGRSESIKCVQIFYDKAENSGKPYYLGRIHAQYLQNVMGHFPSYQQIISPIEKYAPGQIEKCEASFYLGTYYNTEIPDSFISDYIKTKRNVVWAGYQVWKIPKEDLARMWGVEFQGLSSLDLENKDAKGRPGFFRFYDYQGETFQKYGEFDFVDKSKFMASFEIILFKLLTGEAEKKVVSWAKHSTQKNLKTPYVIKDENHWYFGDSPFYFATEEDRYLILADILFDVLKEKPVRGDSDRPAVFRLEDIHPKVQLWYLYKMTDLLYEHKVPFSMTVVPIFTDPLGILEDRVEERFVPITQKREFIDFLKYAEARGATFIFHGVTHQYGKKPNPFSATTGDDFEFWDRVNNIPVDRDSTSFVVNRIEEGRKLLAEAGIQPIAWVSPHYQASPLDYVIFGQLFRWNMGRMIYFPFSKSGNSTLPDSLSIEAHPNIPSGERLKYFQNLKVEYPSKMLPNGQYYPYEIFGDCYGQRVVPENVGNVQAYLNEQVLRTLTIDDMVRIMKRNRKMRDTWASYFIHPFLLEETGGEGLARFPGDVSEIERLVKSSREAGYEFINLKDWIDKQPLTRRPEPIEVF